MALPDPSPVFDTLQKISPSTWITAGGAGVVAFLGGLAFARGVVRQLFSMASLAIAFVVGWFVFRHRGEVFGSMGASLGTDRLLLFSAGAGLLTFFLCKRIVQVLAGIGLLNMLGGLAGWKGLILSAIPSGFLLWTGATVLRQVGNVYGVENAGLAARQSAPLQGRLSAWLHQFSQQIDRSSLGSLAEKLDPFDVRATANLARLLILWPEGSVWRRLAAENPKTAAALNHPTIQRLGQDSKVRQAISRQDFAGLMQLPQVEKAAVEPALRPVLNGLALEEAMDAHVYKRQPAALR